MTFDSALGRPPPKITDFAPTVSQNAILEPPGGLWGLIIELQGPPGAYFRAPGAYFRAPGASRRLYSASRSFWEVIFNLQERLEAYFQPPGSLVVPRASKIPSNEASKTQIGSAGVAKRRQLEMSAVYLIGR